LPLTQKRSIALACAAALCLLLAACSGSSTGDSTTPPPLDGQVLDIPLAHKALVYDAARNAYYASVPGSVVGNGNRIATIDPASGQVSYSAPVGSDPNVLAISSDGGSLYVGLDGSGELLKLALPSMAEQGRVRFPSDPFSGQSHASAMAASPVDPGVVAVTLSGFGVGLLRDLVLQTNFASLFATNDLLAFDAAGAFVYTLDTSSTEEGLRRLAVLSDGLTEETLLRSAIFYTTRALSFDGGRVIAGAGFYDAPALAAAGVVSGAALGDPALVPRLPGSGATAAAASRRPRHLRDPRFTALRDVRAGVFPQPGRGTGRAGRDRLPGGLLGLHLEDPAVLHRPSAERARAATRDLAGDVLLDPGRAGARVGARALRARL
jgi:hypothetical protein